MEGILQLCDISTERTVHLYKRVGASVCTSLRVMAQATHLRKQEEKEKQAMWQCEMTQALIYSVLYVPEDL